jgi:hypothetical protein
MRVPPSICRSAVALAIALTAWAPSADAQRAAGPYAGVLNAAGDAEATHTLDLRGSLFGAWDDTLTSSDDEAVDQRFLRSGTAAGASGSLAHARRSSRIQWVSSVASSMRMYDTTRDATAATFSGQTALTGTVSRRVSLSGSGGLSYSPYYDFGPGLDGRLSNVGAFGGGFGVATAAERNVAATAGAGMNVRLSSRNTFDVNGNLRRHEFLDQDENSFDSWGVLGQFRHQISRGLAFHAGYGREYGRYVGGDRDVASDIIDVGVDYGDTLTFARRTALSFRTSTAAIRWADDTHYRINGNAALTRGFGRSGSVQLSYDRSTEFDAAFREPILRDQVSAGVNNQLGRRTSWSAQIGYMRGNIGFDSAAGDVDSYNAGGSVSVAVNRRIGLFTDYSFYRYEVPAGSTVFTSLQKFSRQSVTAGLTLWVPLISERSSSDSR